MKTSRLLQVLGTVLTWTVLGMTPASADDAGATSDSADAGTEQPAPEAPTPQAPVAPVVAAPDPAPEAAPAPPPAAAPATEGTKLKEVVVTAQRREESVQKVPTPITVLAGDNLTDSGIGRSASQVLDYVPNASAMTQLHGRPRWWIRGVGTGQQQLDFSNPVGFYLDDVYISNASATGFPLFDLDRVEVLRGPQGTLWGKNTTGGAINILSRRPESTPDGYLKFDLGTYSDKVLEGAGGGAVWGNSLAARASFHYESRGGRFENQATNRKDGRFQDGAFRLQLLGKIGSSFEALLNVHLRKYTTDGATATVVGAGPGGTYLNGYVPSTDINRVSTNAPDHGDTTQNGSVLNLRAQLGALVLTSISAYEDFNDETFGDSDDTPLEISRTWAHARSYQLSQELRLASPRTDRWNWVLGGFAFFEDIDRASSTAKLPGVATAVPGPSNYSYTIFDHRTRSFAAFGSTTLNITDALSITGGLRFTSENRRLQLNRFATPATAAAAFSDVGRWWLPGSVTTPLTDSFTSNPSKTWNNLTYDVTPQLALSRNAQVYFRYAHGVKSGGYNTAATNQAALNVVEPEKLDAFELGTKTGWWGGRLVLNASAFHYRYRDIQVNVVGPLPPTNTAVSYLQNVKAGRVHGGELELDSLPLQNLRFGGSLGLLDTKFTDFQVLNNGPNYSGNQFVRSPHLSTLVRAEYRIPLPLLQRPSLVLAADWRYQGKQFHFVTSQDNPLLGQKPFSIVNARISLASGDEKLLLTLYANNLADVRYRNHSLPAARNATGAIAIWGDPLTVGVSLTSRWW